MCEVSCNISLGINNQPWLSGGLPTEGPEFDLHSDPKKVTRNIKKAIRLKLIPWTRKQLHLSP